MFTIPSPEPPEKSESEIIIGRYKSNFGRYFFGFGCVMLLHEKGESFKVIKIALCKGI